MKPFLQMSGRQSTLENWKQILVDNDLPSFGLFAYVTDSGVAQIINHIGEYLSDKRRCRWVFGFDYGRSQPTAVRKLAEVGQSEIRIYDGDYVVQSTGFIPRRSYHVKTALIHQNNGFPIKQIVGSGNLSASGLLSGIEAGGVIDYLEVDRIDRDAFISELEEIWESSTPFENVIDDYERKYTEISVPRVNVITESNINPISLFWIDVGYVTKNRGTGKPGNQFDLPKGSHIHLGLKKILNPKINSTLGELRIRTPLGDTVDRPLRFGNNAMEKLTLPIPEQCGYQCYDGKILTFKVDGNEIVLEALEHDDFLRTYGMYISSSNKMQSGRPYGTISMKDY